MTPKPESRIHGCLLGGAIGDALGAGVEFSSLAEIRRRHGPAGITGYVDPVGRVTDDTQMTLFTAEGLIRARNQLCLRPAGRLGEQGSTTIIGTIHRSYLRWLVTQGDPEPQDVGAPVVDGWLVTNDILHEQRAPGMTCLSGLRAPAMGTVDEPLNDSKGCGGVIRVAPIGLTGRLDDAEVFSTAVEAAAITHGHPSGYLAAGAFAVVIARLGAGDDLRAAIAVATHALDAHARAGETIRAVELALTLAETAPATPETVERLGGGWVAEEALAIGLYCALVAPDVRAGLLLAVNHSGDSDSTGSITGNLLGTHLGIDALPRDLLDGLAERDLVGTVADDLTATFLTSTFLTGALTDAATDLERYPPW